MSDILQEISEDVKKDKLKAFFKSYGIYFITLLILILTLSIIWWQNYKRKQVLRAAEEFNEAMMISSPEEAKDLEGRLKKLTYGDTIYAQLASLQLAAFSTYKEDYNKAFAEYNSLSENRKTVAAIRDYSNLMKIKVRIVSEKLAYDKAVEQLDDYIEKATYFVAQAKFLRANLLMKLNKPTEAKEDFNIIITDSVLPTPFIKISEMLAQSLK